jgi:hypothetical protein
MMNAKEEQSARLRNLALKESIASLDLGSELIALLVPTSQNLAKRQALIV